jgi:hypothetical protein
MEGGLKVCTRCDSSKRVAEFYSRRNECKQCVIRRVRKKTLQSETSFLSYLHTQCRARHKRAGYTADTLMPKASFLSLYFSQNGRCALSGERFVLNDMSRQQLAPSPDRIDNDLGYICGNIQFVTWRINNCRGALTVREFRALCSKVVETSKQKIF